MTQPLTKPQAYRKGWEASKRTKTYDLEAAEERFVENHILDAAEHGGDADLIDAFCAGWIDYASDYEYGTAIDLPNAPTWKGE